uniref:E3 ubiquitin-protein ligase TRIM39-like n=1 Tax=Sinocyclocheilus grahami TaxID=75366 RepID=A0A672LEU6_SINGR
MASSSGPLNEELQCSICLDVFTDPVTTPCGHNFCKTCLKKCWTNTQSCFCPLCKETFSRRPAIKINITLREVVQHFKEKLNQEESEVFCDFCDERKQKNAAEKQAKDLIKELQQEVTELKRRNTELEQLSHTDDHLHLLQVFCRYCVLDTIFFNTLTIQCYIAIVYIIHKKRNILDVTLDPDTANPYLILSDDGKQVSDGDIEQDVPENPKRFDDICVLAKERFSSGRFYYEVQVNGKTGWSLGVARESIKRKEDISPSPEDGLWSMASINQSQCIACDNPAVVFSYTKTPEKVGVFVDYEEGLVSFYDVGSSSHIYSFTGQTFTEKLYPFFGPCDNDKGKNSNPLIISPVSSN